MTFERWLFEIPARIKRHAHYSSQELNSMLIYELEDLLEFFEKQRFEEVFGVMNWLSMVVAESTGVSYSAVNSKNPSKTLKEYMKSVQNRRINLKENQKSQVDDIDSQFERINFG